MTSATDPATSRSARAPAHPSRPPSLPLAPLFAIWFGATLGITIASPGATRMYAWPWWIAYAAALLSPVAILVRRAFDRDRPLRLPTTSWTVLGVASAALVLGSALLSPFRGPVLLWSAPLLAAVAAFFALHDWLHDDGPVEARRDRLLRGAGLLLAGAAGAGMAFWLREALVLGSWRGALDLRNDEPLGHPSYTAGLALLLLPCAVSLALRFPGRERLGWIAAAACALALLLTSASRGGLIGFAVLAACATPALVGALRVRWWVVAAVAVALGAGLLSWNPRLRAMLEPAPAGAEPNLSNVQRVAMLRAAWLMGQDRPVVGWGPGSTPLAYPRYRAQLDGGTENVLQLHSTPAQLWAELGVLGLAAALAGVVLATRSPRPGLLPGLAGYAVFSLTDWQMDVPVFAFALASALAWLAPPGKFAARRAHGRIAGFAALAAAACLALLGRPDPSPSRNARALALARDPAQADEAIALLRESLADDPYQEIAHFNLGWLLVVRDPAAAERHFRAAARLVPDKGGVYFGLGLARLNQGQLDRAHVAFLVEAINDPMFLTSPWWRHEPFASLRRGDRGAAFNRATVSIADQFMDQEQWIAREARYNAGITLWTLLDAPPAFALEDLASTATTPARAEYFAGRPPRPDFARAPIIAYRRERTGYPVLMRQPGIGIPVDLFDVQENALAARDLRFLFPAKGWLPAPALVRLLDSVDRSVAP